MKEIYGFFLEFGHVKIEFIMGNDCIDTVKSDLGCVIPDLFVRTSEQQVEELLGLLYKGRLDEGNCGFRDPGD